MAINPLMAMAALMQGRRMGKTRLPAAQMRQKMQPKRQRHGVNRPRKLTEKDKRRARNKAKRGRRTQ